MNRIGFYILRLILLQQQLDDYSYQNEQLNQSVYILQTKIQTLDSTIDELTNENDELHSTQVSLQQQVTIFTHQNEQLNDTL